MASILGLDTFGRSPLDGATAPPYAFALGRATPGGRRDVQDTDEVIPSVVARTHGGRFPYAFPSRAVNGYPVGKRLHIGYAFRGARRPPTDFAASGGIWSYATRVTALSEVPEPEPGRYVEPGRVPIEFGFAKKTQVNVFASPYVDKAITYGAWTYAFLVVGALSVCPGELLVPGGIEWDDVVAYRSRDDGQLFVRDGFPTFDPTGWAMLRYELSYTWP